MINIYYVKKSKWEMEFFKNDIFNTKIMGFVNFIYFDDNFDVENEKNKNIDFNILVTNDMVSFNKTKEIIDKLSPKIIFILSDEVGNREYLNDLQKNCRILFRQHLHKKYKYEKNNFNIPLAYAAQFLSGKSSSEITVKKIIERELEFSFIGAIKKDRAIMCNLFEENFKNNFINRAGANWNDVYNQKINPAKMFDIYNNSLFIPIGRGNCNLNCSRLYECIIAGAIPVIVASHEESDYQFTFNYGKPIIIINNSWEDAVIKCKELLNNKDELQKIQDYNIEWWNNEIKFIQDKILSL
jgi:hypothetical protein